MPPLQLTSHVINSRLINQLTELSQLNTSLSIAILFTWLCFHLGFLSNHIVHPQKSSETTLFTIFKTPNPTSQSAHLDIRFFTSFSIAMTCFWGQGCPRKNRASATPSRPVISSKFPSLDFSERDKLDGPLQDFGLGPSTLLNVSKYLKKDF